MYRILSLDSRFWESVRPSSVARQLPRSLRRFSLRFLLQCPRDDGIGWHLPRLDLWSGRCSPWHGWNLAKRRQSWRDHFLQHHCAAGSDVSWNWILKVFLGSHFGVDMSNLINVAYFVPYPVCEAISFIYSIHFLRLLPFDSHEIWKVWNKQEHRRSLHIISALWQAEVGVPLARIEHLDDELSAGHDGQMLPQLEVTIIPPGRSELGMAWVNPKDTLCLLYIICHGAFNQRWMSGIVIATLFSRTTCSFKIAIASFRSSVFWSSIIPG